MAKCNRCGKKGFLLKLDKNGLCPECAAAVRQIVHKELAKQDKKIAQRDKELSRQDALLKKVLKAQEQYSEDGDIEKAITAFEAAIIKEKPPLLNAQGHTRFLVDLYKKSGQNDKAWGLLNSCLLDSAMYGGRTRMPIWNVRLEMAKILKSEKKYSDAIEMYMLKFLHDADSAYETDAHEERFRKNIKPCISKLKWDDETVNDLCAIVKNNISNGNDSIAAEPNVTQQYRTYLNEHHLNL